MSLLLGFRDHALLFIERAYIDNGQYEPVIYDPSGSYARSIDTGNGEQLFHENASFEIYKDFYRKHDNSTVDITCNYETTAEAEMNFYKKVMELGDRSGPACATTISTILEGSPFFLVLQGELFSQGIYLEIQA